MPITFEELKRRYEAITPEMQPRETSLEFIRRTCAAIDDLDALDSFG
ncbi:MAG: hypothetical protein ACU85V_20045 [Gammaproteobacteria bacterium]